jgi:SAM-dependent methyltransferase
MSEAFNAEVAAAYDFAHAGKDYAAECTAVVRCISHHSRIPVSSVLDVGCGTGGHALELGRRGYTVTGIDRSAHMIAMAEQKRARTGLGDRVSFAVTDGTRLQLPHPADAAIMMFAVLSHQDSLSEARRLLRGIRANVLVGALLVFDTWYLPAVAAQRPGRRWRAMADGADEVLRLSDGVFDGATQQVQVSVDTLRICGDRITSRTHEVHAMRCFTRDELTTLLADSGFEPVAIGGFPDLDHPAGIDTWSVGVVARAV